MSAEPTKAYIVRRRVHAIDEMLVYADSVADAKARAKAGEYVYTERLPGSNRLAGFESVKRYPEEDRG
jgi:hypothetical protein